MDKFICENCKILTYYKLYDNIYCEKCCIDFINLIYNIDIKTIYKYFYDNNIKCNTDNLYKDICQKHYLDAEENKIPLYWFKISNYNIIEYVANDNNLQKFILMKQIIDFERENKLNNLIIY